MRHVPNAPRANLDDVARELTKRCSKLRVDAFYVWKAAPVQPGDVIYHFVSALEADSGLQLVFHAEGDSARPFQVNLLECSSPLVMRDLVVFESALAVRLPGILDARREGEQILLIRPDGELRRPIAGRALEMSIVSI